MSEQQKSWMCELCGDAPDAPMLKDEVWNIIHGKNHAPGKRLLCFECVEHLLKRRLALRDLKECSANYPTFVMVRRAMEEKKPKVAEHLRNK